MGQETEANDKTQSLSEGSVPNPRQEPHNNPDTSNATPNKDHAASPLVQQTADAAAKMDTGDSADKDAVLAKIEAEKILALIKAWEESERTKVENRAYKRHSAVGFWEDSKKASAEAKLKRIEEKLERKKAEYVEKMENKIAEIHRLAEERRARVEAHKGQELLKVEENATKFRTRGYSPRKLLSCFSA